MANAIKALTVCAGGAALGLAFSGGNPLGALGGCAAATMAVTVTGCAPENDYEGSRLSTETAKVKPLAEKLTENCNSTEEEVISITQWAQNNLFHYSNFGPGRFYGLGIYGKEDEIHGGLHDISIESILSERAVGCHYASGVLITMLRSLEIAAEYVTETVNGEVHGLTYIPSLDRYIHGDHVANLVCIPAEELLHSSEEEDFWRRHAGVPASEIGYAPEVGLISASFYAFQIAMWKKYGYLLELQRTGEMLHIAGSALEEDPLKAGPDVCPEYHLRLGEIKNGKQFMVSDFIPIQGLEELIEEPSK